jgi:CP family cyanate transporter-like MFS transporter
VTTELGSEHVPSATRRSPTDSTPGGDARRLTHGRPAGAVLCLVAIFVAAVNLRPALSSISPVLPTILTDFGAGSIFGGLLTTVPVICMGVLAPLSLRAAARFGSERVVVASLALIGGTTLLRAWSPGPVVLLATALGVGVGIALAGTLLPVVGKVYFPERVTLVTGVYALGINLGAGCAALATAPLTQASHGSWRAGLSAWAAMTVVALVLWVPIAAHTRTQPATARVRLPLRNSQAWAVTAFFGVQSFVYYGILTWLATLYEDRGWSRTSAGALLALFTLFQMTGALGVATAAQRSGDIARWTRLTAAAGFVGLLLIALAPEQAPIAWVAILGLGVGGIFPLSLTLPLISCATAEDARAWTSMTFGVGYVVAAAGPFAIGALRTWTGGFELAFLMLALLNVAIIVSVRWVVPPRRMV